MTNDNRWDDKHFIQNIKGSLTDFPLFFVLLSAHALKLDCTITIESRQAKRSLFIKSGGVVGSLGFINLLDALKIPSLPASSMGDLMGHAISKGHRPDLVIDSIVMGLSSELLSIGTKGTVQIQDFNKPSIPIKLTKTIPTILMNGCNIEANDNFLDVEYSAILGHRINPTLPLGFTPSSLELPPKIIRFFKSITNETLVHQLLGDTSTITNKWKLLHFVNRMGLVSIDVQKESSKSKSKTTTESNQRQAEHQDSQENELQNKFKELTNLEPHVLLQIQTPRDANEVTIDRQYRKLSSAYHPDRFSLANQKVQDIAQSIFQLYTEVNASLKEESVIAELKKRLDAEERGEKYVSENDRKQSALIYEQARFLFQRRRYKDAGELLKKCLNMNPDPWRFHYMYLQTQRQTSQMSAQEAGQAILAIQGVGGHQRLEVMIKAAEYFIDSADAESQVSASNIVKQVLDIQPDHKTALRLKSLLSRRTDSEEKKPKAASNSFFKSLFKKK